MTKGRRILAVVLVVAAVGATGVHYDAAYDQRWPYPSEEALKTNPGAYAGTEVFLIGTVRAVDESADAARLEVESDAGPLIVEVTGFEAAVTAGGTAQVVGTFRGDGTVAAETVRIVNPAGASKLYKYLTSAVGALLVLGLFFRHWRVNIRELHFERR